jgi:hypothetical protein
MKNVCIVFSGGCYGTFTEWCLNYFSDPKFPTDMPFTALTNAHKFKGNHLVNTKRCLDYIRSDNNFEFVRFHPKINEQENVLENLKLVSQHFKKVIFNIPTNDTIIWSLNNKLEKIWGIKEWLRRNDALINENIKRWKVCDSYSQLDTWELREFLSFFIYEQHLAETELEDIQVNYKNLKNVHTITLKDFKTNFKNTINDLLEYCQISPIRIETLDYIHSVWLENQHHMFKDELISKIVDSLLTDKFYSWHDKNLTLGDEALIQYFLRQHGIEIRCYNLNTFPTNTADLKKLYVKNLT